MKHSAAQSIPRAVSENMDEGLPLSDAERQAAFQLGIDRLDVKEALDFVFEVSQTGEKGELAFPNAD